MADPQEGISGIRKHRVTEGTLTVDADPVVTLETGNSEYIELVNKGPNAVYFRCDGETPTAGATGNADALAADANRFIPLALIAEVNFICDTDESATVFYRLYT